MDPIFIKVVDLVASATDRDKVYINESSHLLDDLNLDSMDMAELMVTIEREYNISSVPDDPDEEPKTVGDLVTFIKKEQATVHA